MLDIDVNWILVVVPPWHSSDEVCSRFDRVLATTMEERRFERREA